MKTQNLENQISERFPNKPDDYAESVAERFQAGMEKFETNKKVFGDSTKAIHEDVKIGKRYRFKNGLYEVVAIFDEAKDEEVKVNLAKVLKTKVSDNHQNVAQVSLSKLRNTSSFEEYNKMVDAAYEIAFDK